VGELKIKEAIANGLNVTGEEDFCYFLAVLFPSDQLKILEYNRVVRDLNGFSEDGFLEQVRGGSGARAVRTPCRDSPPCLLLIRSHRPSLFDRWARTRILPPGRRGRSVGSR
jgi:hypothetical protein